MSEKYSAAERLLNLIFALQSASETVGISRNSIRKTVRGYQEPATAAAFERMFERDKAQLKELNVPLVVINPDGPNDEVAYRIAGGKTGNGELYLTPVETGLLQLASRVWQSRSDQHEAALGLTKLRAAGEYRPEVDVTLPFEARLPAAGPHLGPLTAAADQRIAVQFKYTAANQSVETPLSTRRVQPWKTFTQENAWYLVGWDLDREQTRIFALGRIKGHIDLISEPGSYTKPDDIDRFTEFYVDEDTETVRLQISPGRMQQLQRHVRSLKLLEPGEQKHTVEVQVSAVLSLVYRLASYGRDAVVVQPKNVRELAIEALEHAVKLDQAPQLTETQLSELQAEIPVTKRKVSVGKSTSGRLTRMLSLLSYAKNFPEGVSMADLATYYEVSEQEIVDDVNILWCSGLPGKSGEYPPETMIEIDEGLYERSLLHVTDTQELDRPIPLSPSEAISLIAALQVLQELAEQSGNEDSVATITALLDKLRTYTGAQGESLEIRVNSHVPDQITAAVGQGVQQAKQLETVYVNARGEVSNRRLDPISLTSIGNHTYLRAWCHLTGEARNFRLDRFNEVEVLDSDVEVRDAGAGRLLDWDPLDLVGVEFAREARWVAESPFARAVQDLPDGAFRVLLSVVDPAWLESLLLSTAQHVRAISHLQYAANAALGAREALRNYSQQPVAP